MFEGCSSLTTLDLSNFDTSNVESMSWMFGECSSLTNLNLNGWILKDGNDYNSMFCHVLEDIVNNSGLQNNLTENTRAEEISLEVFIDIANNLS